MRVHYLLNQGGSPEGKLADVEIHFEEGLLAGLKLVGCSVWRSRKGDALAVMVPARSYQTMGGVRYYDLLRPSGEGGGAEDAGGRSALRAFKEQIRDEYLRIAGRPKDRGAAGAGANR